MNVIMTNTSELRVNVVVEGKNAKRALEALQKTFEGALV
ncbi:MAG: hypothetical protein ACK5Q3_09155 [Planctomycetota bacterium]